EPNAVSGETDHLCSDSSGPAVHRDDVRRRTKRREHSPIAGDLEAAQYQGNLLSYRPERRGEPGYCPTYPRGRTRSWEPFLDSSSTFQTLRRPGDGGDHQ